MEYYKYKDFSEKSTVLIKRLGYLPLALEQAAAYIKEVRCSISDYLELLNQSSVDAFSDKYASPEYYTSIVTSTWNISFAALEDSSQQLLNLCAYMGADNIPVNFFCRNEGSASGSPEKCSIKTVNIKSGCNRASNVLFG